MHPLILKLRHLYWRWMLARARDFQYRLENTIANERLRARDDVNHSEIMERRALTDLAHARADGKRREMGRA